MHAPTRMQHAHMSQASVEDPALADLQAFMQELKAEAEDAKDMRPLMQRLKGAIDTVLKDDVDRENHVMKEADALVESLGKKQVALNKHGIVYSEMSSFKFSTCPSSNVTSATTLVRCLITHSNTIRNDLP